MADDGARCGVRMLAFAKRTKAFFLHACPHALDLCNVVMIDSAEGVTHYVLASGRAQSLEHYRIFGAGAY